jgi:hypothetical protein
VPGGYAQDRAIVADTAHNGTTSHTLRGAFDALDKFSFLERQSSLNITKKMTCRSRAAF